MEVFSPELQKCKTSAVISYQIVSFTESSQASQAPVPLVYVSRDR